MTRRHFLMNTVALAAGAAVAGCAKAEDPATGVGAARPEAKGSAGAAAKGRVLVAYYSWSGNTKALAGLVAAAVGGELFEISPKVAYPEAYRACTEQAKREIAAGARPELAAWPDFAKYDVVLVGSPNWWRTIAPPMSTFVENPALAGKRMALFQTHGGGGAQRCGQDFKKQAKGNVVAEPLIVTGSRAARAQAEAAKWAHAIVG